MFWTIFTYIILPFFGLLVAYTLYMSRKHGMLEKLGIPGPKPWPIFGTVLEDVKQGAVQCHINAYRKYRGHKAYSGYLGPQPLIYPRDLDMIRDICVKHFDKFTNRNARDICETSTYAMMFLKGDHWKRVRSTVSPAFSSGKLKRMVSSVQQHAQRLVQHLRDKQERNEELELKDTMSRFSMDTVASTGFGVSIDSFENSDNDFQTYGKRVMRSFNNCIAINIFAGFLWPVVKTLTNLVPEESFTFFKSFVDAALERRKEDQDVQSKRNDFVQLVLEAQEEGGHKALTHKEIQSQAISFIFGGFDTTATVMSFTLFLLANHPECCVQVQEEIDRILKGESPDYENVQKLTYLEMCVNEAIRMYPPGFLIDRMCNEDVEIQGVKFPKGVMVLLPVCGIHNDPEIYPEPEKFNPERFTAEEKEARHPYAFLPFGQGPRNCVGMRFALMTLKIGLASVLQVMTPVPCDQTVFPARLKTYIIEAKDGLWVKMEARQKTKA